MLPKAGLALQLTSVTGAYAVTFSRFNDLIFFKTLAAKLYSLNITLAAFYCK